MQKYKKFIAKALSLVLTMVMVLTMLPTTALAGRADTYTVGDGGQYASIDAVLEHPGNSVVLSTIKLVSDLEASAIGDNEHVSFYIDLNGYTLKSDGTGPLFAGDSSITFKNSASKGGVIDINGQPLTNYDIETRDGTRCYMSTSSETAPITIENSGGSGTGTIYVASLLLYSESYVILDENVTVESPAYHGTTFAINFSVPDSTLINNGIFKSEGRGKIQGTFVNGATGRIYIGAGSVDSIDNTAGGKVYVTGGSIKSITETGNENNVFFGTSDATPAVQYTFTLNDGTADLGDDIAVDSLTTTPAYAYGMGGVKTRDTGKLYIWVPSGLTAASATVPTTAGEDAGAYANAAISGNTAILTGGVSKTPLTVTGVSVADKTYDGQPAVLSGVPTYTLQDGSAVSDYAGTWDYLYTSTDGGGYSASTAPSNAGAYKLTVTANDDKYEGTQENIAFTISKATVTIAAPNKSAYVGDAVPVLSASDCTITGLAAGQALKTAPTVVYATTPDMTQTGSVAINVSGAAVPESGNYNETITYQSGTLTISNKSSGGGGGSSSDGSSVTVDGKTESIGKVETKNDTTTVVVDSAKLDSKVSAAKDGSSVIVPVSTTKDSAAAQLVVSSVEKMAAKNMTLEVKSGNTTYALPAAAIDAKGVVAQLGATDASQVPFTVTITNEKDVKVEGSTLVVPAVSFTVSASYDGKTVTVDRFDTMVPRTIEITKDQAAKVTTAVVVEKDGTVRHVPTNVYQEGGKWYAKFSSMTNSTYALITNESTLTDVDGKWYADAANELSAREVTEGVFGTTFEGDKDITRAEFAALLVNGLGLPKTASADFTDVSADAWYSQYIATAVEYGIVKGIGSNRFAPDATITRQEAMVMMARAAQVIAYTGKTGDVSTFSDVGSVAKWAMDAVALNVGSGLIEGSDGKLMPLDNISRAQTATVILRLLQQAELVDVRTGSN